MKILALDPATKCGWAHSSGESGVWDLSIRKDESGGMRLLRFRAKLREIHELIGMDVVMFEAARNLQYGNAVRVAAQLQAIIETWCTDNNVEYRGYSPTEIKKHATGKGNAGKDAMIAAAEKRFSRESLDENEADALWLLDLAKKQLHVS